MRFTTIRFGLGLEITVLELGCFFVIRQAVPVLTHYLTTAVTQL